MSGEVIQDFGPDDKYKYLSLHQLLGICDSDVRQQTQKKVLTRVDKICRSFLSSRNKITAINTWAITVATYTFGTVKWSVTELQAVDRKIRTTLTKHRMHHPRGDIDQLYLARKNGGRLAYLAWKHSVVAKKNDSESTFYYDRGYTPLDLQDPQMEICVKTHDERIEAWKAKALHGKFAHQLFGEHIYLKVSTEWLRTAGLFAETEGFILAIQDQAIRTRNYERYILKIDIDDRCRLCRLTQESIEHITAGCSVLSQTEHLGRHNAVAKVLHQALAKRYRLIESEEPYYMCKPESVLENKDAKLLWDFKLGYGQSSRCKQARSSFI
ncbi:hypothetical protein B566_EDAN017259 [Ephemera danica]|nr:hypothetical protein B566_EDAN017259 [Ephemera danica]